MRASVLILICLTVFLISCNSEEKTVKDTVRDILIDPGSANFEDFISNETNDKACISVNSNNRLGGYTGFTIFELEKNDSIWTIVSTDGRKENCTRKHFKVRDSFDKYKKDYPELLLIKNFDYLGDNDLERWMAVSEEMMAAGRKVGLSRDEIIRKMNEIMSSAKNMREEENSYH